MQATLNYFWIACFSLMAIPSLQAQTHYPIEVVTTTDANGIPDSSGLIVELRGVVHSNDFIGPPQAIQFAFQDSSGGIWAIGPEAGLGYVPFIGDSIHVIGEINQLQNGITRIQPSNIILISSGNATYSPTLIDSLNEQSEGDLVRINSVALVDPSQWTTGQGNGFTVAITNGIADMFLRIDNDMPIFNEPPPSGLFDVIGIGAQFDQSLPYTEGYLLYPRDSNDIIPSTDVALQISSETNVFESAGSVQVTVSLLNPTMDTIWVELNQNGGTASVGLDYTWTDTLLTFIPEGDSILNLSLNLIDDADIEGNEDLLLSFQNLVGNAILLPAEYTINIVDNDYPFYTISQVTGIDPVSGVADSVNARCELSGVVYGVNLQAPQSGALQFTLIDPTDGIGVFAPQDFGYSVQEGDSLSVVGTIQQGGNGMTFIILDSLSYISSGNNLKSPALVSALDETTESDLVRLEVVRLVNPNQWQPGPGGGFNAFITDNTNIYSLFVDREVMDVFTSSAPQGWFHVNGLGAQFAQNGDLLTGYTIMPRYLADIEMLPDPTVGFEQPADTVSESAGNLNVDILQTDGNPDTTIVDISVVTGLSTATEGVDFNLLTNTVVLTGLGTSSGGIQIELLDDLDVEGDETLTLLITMATNNAIISQDNYTLIIQDDATDAIEPELAATYFKLYPNPGNESFQLESKSPILNIRIRDYTGKSLINESLNYSLIYTQNLKNYAAGIYLIEVQTPEGIWNMKWIKE